ncbi:MAG: hypothetical protein U9O41_09295 [Candidatus Aerophobetes bacterium]|nr:hypothetical protein [Candidatus Aerophobetes bacterium]
MRKIKALVTIFLVVILFSFFDFKVFAEPSIMVDTSTGRITVRAPRKKLKEIEKMIPQFPLETRQVQIKARILELTESGARSFGIYIKRLTGVKAPEGTEGEGTILEYGPKTLTEIASKEIGGLGFTFYRLLTGEEEFQALLNMLVSKGEAKVLSEPRVTTISGEVAGIYDVEDVSYLSKVTTTTEAGVTKETKEYTYVTVGVVLQVLPRIIGGEYVQVSIVPLLSDYSTEKFGADRPVFSRRVSPTNITVRSGEPIIIGGLIKEKKEETKKGLPILSDLPIIGDIFTSRKTTKSRKDLLITLIPHILKPREIKGRSKRVFTFKYALAEEVANRIKDIISSRGMMELNPEEAPPNSILVRDSEDKVEVIQKMLNRIGTFEEQRREEVFPLKFSSLEEAKEALSPLLSSKGNIRIDKEKYSLIIEDGAYQLMRIREALSSLEKHNQKLQRKSFSLKYAEGRDIIPLLREFLSPRGNIYIKEDRLVVVDNNWVIQKIAEEIRKLDDFDSQKKSKVYLLKYVRAERLYSSEEFKRTLSSILYDKATVKVDAKRNALVVTALKKGLGKVEKEVENFDIYRPEEMSYQAKYCFAASLSKKIIPLLSDKGEIKVNEEKNSIFVKDCPYYLSLIKENLSSFDSFKREKREETIRLKYAPLPQIIQIIRELKSPSAKILSKDKEKNEFVFQEALYPLKIIKQKVLALDKFDKWKGKRAYKLKYIEASDIVPIIRLFLSDKGNIIIHNHNKIAVIDTPYYQAKIKNSIEVLDAPLP